MSVAAESQVLELRIQNCLLQWCSKVILKEQLTRKELLTDGAAAGKVFAELQECEIDGESTWDDSDQRGSMNTAASKRSDQSRRNESCGTMH